jgi:hypothetical protein
MKRLFSTLAALAAGAAAMYYLDPETGRRRRVVTRDRIGAASRDASSAARSKGKHTADRIKGLMRSGLSHRMAAPTSDAQLQARIRTRLGRLVSHPKAVDVTVKQGRVHLGGHILDADVGPLLSELESMPGVESVDNGLRVHDEPGSVSELQGRPHPRRRSRGALRSVLPLIAAVGPIAMLMRRGSAHHLHAHHTP